MPAPPALSGSLLVQGTGQRKTMAQTHSFASGGTAKKVRKNIAMMGLF